MFVRCIGYVSGWVVCQVIITYLFYANEFGRHGWLHNETDEQKVSVGLLSIAKLDKICLFT